MTKFRISATIEAPSAAEAVSYVILNENAEYRTDFLDITVTPLHVSAPITCTLVN